MILLKVEKLFFLYKGGGKTSLEGLGGSGRGNKRQRSGGSEVQNLPSDLAKPINMGTVFLHNVTVRKMIKIKIYAEATKLLA